MKPIREFSHASLPNPQNKPSLEPRVDQLSEAESGGVVASRSIHSRDVQLRGQLWVHQPNPKKMINVFSRISSLNRSYWG